MITDKYKKAACVIRKYTCNKPERPLVGDLFCVRVFELVGVIHNAINTQHQGCQAITRAVEQGVCLLAYNDHQNNTHQQCKYPLDGKLLSGNEWFGFHRKVEG
jgi:hypothetical protein